MELPEASVEMAGSHLVVYFQLSCLVKGLVSS